MPQKEKIKIIKKKVKIPKIEMIFKVIFKKMK